MSAVALPIETKARELHGKLWLGLHLLERGHDIVLGPSWEVDVTLHKTQPDAYISQGPSDSKIDRFTELRQAGIRVYGLPPESGIGSSIEQIVTNKKQIVNHIDGFLCWGQKYKEALSKHYDNTDNIYLTGNPRFDLRYRRFRALYNKRAENLRTKHGKFILVNTNFGRANAFDQNQMFGQLERLYDGVEIENFRHQKRTFYLFLEAILHFSDSLDEVNIIIRPHPGENHDAYSQAFDPFENIKVIYSGDARTWITAAEIVLHHDCTTGIESVLIGTPTVSYRPIDTPESDTKIAQAISNEVFERDHLVKTIQSLVSDEPQEMSSEQKNLLRPYFYNIDSCAAEAISDIIGQKEPMSAKNYERIRPTKRELVEARVRATRWSEQATKAYDTVRQLLGEDSLRGTRKKRQQKFPGLVQDEIIEIVENLTVNKSPLRSIKKVSGVDDTFRLCSK